MDCFPLASHSHMKKAHAELGVCMLLTCFAPCVCRGALWLMCMPQVMAVEVMWTPEAEGDAFTTTDMMTTYPHLAPLL